MFHRIQSLAIAVTLAALVPAVALPAGPAKASPARADVAVAATFEPRSAMNNKCLEIFAFGNDNGSRAGMWDCETGSPPFSEADMAFAAELSAPATTTLRRALLMSGIDDATVAGAPGLLMVAGDGARHSSRPTAQMWLDELHEVRRSSGRSQPYVTTPSPAGPDLGVRADSGVPGPYPVRDVDPCTPGRPTPRGSR
ncbi:hypothetical protein OG792_20780 [Micromonospora sp. NBC_01699]|uniref:hypothetical protein n=1 Tax=Micromonospora sp. NBC_01699 TaxID=2975984 RepID=UPI002E296759|nr:hypothetical protein [Micromonospora sp. NBC_01699]